MHVIQPLHRYPCLLTRTTHVSFPNAIGVMTAKDPVIPSIHTCYYTYKPKCHESRSMIGQRGPTGPRALVIQGGSWDEHE